ncbi:haloalkane dehalogenase [Williamsia sp. CHRR-6]|uniref:haloalkane dehalogenase n=1 Tax=Williamsia sp. CHRR-6 TaxID=2835871 RepID=UPI001BDA6133|nr:haloalkane dehalogenase [Williamsia sp. CHRR-6]MBT0567672.1 alpha/beta fold hydrolase [Williamsia sp. CHRR-6]
MDVYRTPDDRFVDLVGWDFAPNYFDYQGLRVHYIDEGDPSAPPVVMLHGDPTWGYLFRHFIGPLVDAGYRVIAHDHVGFGRSDKPTDRSAYTYALHSAVLAHLMDHLGVSGATIVGHDWGGIMGMEWAGDHVDRVQRLVLMSTNILIPPLPPGITAYQAYAVRHPDLPIGSIIGGGTYLEVPPAVQAGYEAPFPTAMSKAGAVQFAQLLPSDPDSPEAAALARIRDLMSVWTKPTIAFFSVKDPVFPYPESGEALTALIPALDEPIILDGCSHFMQEERSEVIVGRLLDWMTS